MLPTWSRRGWLSPGQIDADTFWGTIDFPPTQIYTDLSWKTGQMPWLGGLLSRLEMMRDYNEEGEQYAEGNQNFSGQIRKSPIGKWVNVFRGYFTFFGNCTVIEVIIIAPSKVGLFW